MRSDVNVGSAEAVAQDEWNGRGGFSNAFIAIAAGGYDAIARSKRGFHDIGTDATRSAGNELNFEL